MKLERWTPTILIVLTVGIMLLAGYLASRQKANGSFVDVSEPAGVNAPQRASWNEFNKKAGFADGYMAVGQAWGDYDNDGLVDLYVTGNLTTSTLYHNSGDGTFTVPKIAKDVSLPHLLARISALFRRMDAVATHADADEIVSRGNLILDLNRMAASWNNQPVPLTLTEFWMVHALAKFPGHMKDRDHLMSEAKLTVDDATITSHIKRIRKKFAALDSAFDAIETLYGMGYRWKE